MSLVASAALLLVWMQNYGLIETNITALCLEKASDMVAYRFAR